MTKQHKSAATKSIFKQLEKKGFTVTSKSHRGSIKIIPPASMKGKPVYHTHGTESAYHQLRRDFKKLYDVELN